MDKRWFYNSHKIKVFALQNYFSARPRFEKTAKPKVQKIAFFLIALHPIRLLRFVRKVSHCVIQAESVIHPETFTFAFLSRLVAICPHYVNILLI
jgi:hypothetical protein